MHVLCMFFELLNGDINSVSPLEGSGDIFFFPLRPSVRTREWTLVGYFKFPKIIYGINLICI